MRRIFTLVRAPRPRACALSPSDEGPRTPRPANSRPGRAARSRRRGRQRRRGAQRASSMTQVTADRATRLRQQKLELPPAERAAPAGARAAGAAGDPDAARRPRRHQGLRRAREQRADRSRPAQQHDRSQQLPRGARGSRASTMRAYREEMRTRDHAARCCASAMSAAHQRSPRARSTSTSTSRRRHPSGARRVQRLAHPDRRGAGGHARAARRRRRSARTRSTSAPRAVRTSPSSRSPIPKPDRARGRCARLAQGQRAADLPRRRRRQAQAR